MRDERGFFTVLLSVFDLFWLLSAIRYRKQADNSLYREDCEPEDGRKVRSSVGRGILGIVIVGVIALVMKSSAFSMTKYIYRTRIAAEQNVLCDIRDALAVSFEEIETQEEREEIADP